MNGQSRRSGNFSCPVASAMTNSVTVPSNDRVNANVQGSMN